MNQNVKLLVVSLLCLPAGFSIGYFVGRDLAYKKAEKEIESVKKSFEKHYTELKNNKDNVDKDARSPKEIINDRSDRDEAEQFEKFKNSQETNYSKVYTKEKLEKISNADHIYQIDPHEAANSEYDIETIFIFKDDTCSDSDYNRINNRSEIIGNVHYEDLEDCVYIQNDFYKKIYEVFADARSYSEVMTGVPDEDGNSDD